MINYTCMINGFASGRLLRARRETHSVSVWRDEDGVWSWAVLGWDHGGRAWQRLSGESGSQLMAVGDGLAAMDTEFRDALSG